MAAPESNALADTRVSTGVALQAGTVILDGRFRVEKLLGGGGMGLVYVAEQVSLGRKVAVKVLRHDLPPVAGAAERFAREARLLSSVEHPAVVRVIDFGQHGSAACIVMEYVEGESLEKVLAREAPLSVERVERLLEQLAGGLGAIHAKGIIHRDLKPENIVLTRGADGGEQARLLDFGIARLAETEQAASVTQQGLVLGTPEYIAPEQALGQTLDARTDLYALGVVAFRMLTGRHPFTGPTPQQFVAQHVHQPPPSVMEAAPLLQSFPSLAWTVMSSLEKVPDLRPSTAQAFVERLHLPPPTTSGEITSVLPLPSVTAPTGASPASRLPSLGALPKLPALSKRPGPKVLGLVAGGVALVLVAGLLAWRDPVRAARRLVEAGRGPEALQVIEDAGDVGKTAPMLMLRAAASHQAGRHDEEWKQLESLGAAESLEDAAVQGLADDYGRNDSPRLRKLFAELPKALVVPALQRLARGELSWAEWGALRYLDTELMGQGLPLADLYVKTLESRDCHVRTTAAKRLGELRSAAAVEPLKQLKALPKKKGLVTDEDCGQDAAAQALGKLERELAP